MNLFNGPRCLTRAASHLSRSFQPIASLQPSRAWRSFSTSPNHNAEERDADSYSLFKKDGSRSNMVEESNVEDFTAAPEIDVNFAGEDPEVYNHELPLLSRIRVVPDSPSYYSGMPDATDEFLYIQSLYLKYLSLPRIESFTEASLDSTLDGKEQKRKKSRNVWTKFEDFKAMPGRPMKRTRYDSIVSMLDSLAAIEPVLMPSSVSALIEKYRVIHPHAGRIKIKPTLDAWGRGVGVGNRKTASAKVFLVKGEGEVLVNGQGLVEAFPKLHDRESALWPLKVTDRMDTYNVWITTRGGGSTGQAEAITLGLARALLVHEPELFKRLFEAGCLWRDPRVVERKKPGHVKARKMPTWVKR